MADVVFDEEYEDLDQRAEVKKRIKSDDRRKRAAKKKSEGKK